MSSQVMPELVIEPGRGINNYWRDLWRYRELFFFLSWRDVLLRYKQTTLGVAWAILRPLAMTVVFTLVFSNVAKLPSGSIPYPLLVYAGLLPWQFFGNALTDSSNSLIANANILTKVYFPRLIIPATAIIVGLVDLACAFAVLLLLMAWYQVVPQPGIVLLPLFVLLAAAASLGAGLWVGALNVKYRDFRYVVPFMVQLGLYVSPVGFSSVAIPEQWRLLYSLNPMVGVIDGFRWALLGVQTPIYWPGVAMSIVLTSVLLVSGLVYFRRVERNFADII